MNALKGIGLVVFCAVASAACTELRESTPTPPANGCLGCHGDDDSIAPMDELHQTHVLGSKLFASADCGDCHVVPETASALGHADTELPAEVVFAGAAIAPTGAAPSYDAANKACANIGCHGEGLQAPSGRALTWAPPEPSNFYCVGCHQAPQTATHPTIVGAAPDSCAQCHGEVTAANHIDGTLDLALSADCSSCHGDELSPAPTDALHRAHIIGGDSREVGCVECHSVPATTDAAGHLDAAPAELMFGALAGLTGSPTWNGSSCSDSYCHSGRSGGTMPRPDWSLTTALDCGSCHGAPPPAPHPAVDDCSMCHGEVVDAARTIVAPDRHVDGILDENTPTTCTGCHGTVDSPAPVDAGHDTHFVAAANIAAAIACETCHVVPATVLAAGHIDAAPAEVTFGGLAVPADASPAYDASTCSSTYCHGAATPTWGDSSGTWNACDSCHGAPPAAPHPISNRCEVCHSDVAAAGPTIAAPALHLDGLVQTVTPACNSCHGSATTPAPDQGAHLAHVDFGYDCSECHVTPQAVTDAGHLDSLAPAEVTFAAGGQWSVADQTCANTHCHSPAGDGTLSSPQWDATDGAAKQCGSCHALPPATAPHLVNPTLNCDACHKAFPAKHVNGITDFTP